MATLNPDWLSTALEITGGFETSGNPWAGVTGDFDDMGISCGVLQWNIGQGSLQPLVKKAGEALVTKAMPVNGKAFWTACTSPIPDGLKIVRSWQTGNKLKSQPLAELRALFGSDPLKQIQLEAAGKVGTTALTGATAWAQDCRNGPPTKREFCWFFDLFTQNGGLKGLDLADVQAFKANTGGDGPIDAICDWMESAPSSVSGFRDAQRNGNQWRIDTAKPGAADVTDLLILSYLRCLKSRTGYQHLTLNRKGTLAIGTGYVNGEHTDVTARYA